MGPLPITRRFGIGDYRGFDLLPEAPDILKAVVAAFLVVQFCFRDTLIGKAQERGYLEGGGVFTGSGGGPSLGTPGVSSRTWNLVWNFGI